MRISVVVEDGLMDEALEVSGLKTKRAAINEGLRLLVRTRRQGQIRRLRGALTWEGMLDNMRRDE